MDASDTLINSAQSEARGIALAPAMAATNSQRLKQLDGWRAVSVVFVILHHIGYYQHPRLLTHFPGLGHLMYYWGPLGVKIFFVISGFVICRLLVSEESRYGSVSLKAFYYRRAFRIIPPLLIYLCTVFLLLQLGLIVENGRAIFDAGLFLSDLRFPPRSWLVGHTWSLAVEEQFYLVFPAMWILLPVRWRSRAFIGVCILCAIFYLPSAFTTPDPLFFGDARAGFICISCGVLMAIHEGRVRSMAARVPNGVVVLVALILVLHPAGEANFKAWVYEGLLAPPAIALVLLSTLERESWLRSLLCCKAAQAIGITSYGIYLWQQLFTAPARVFTGYGQVILLFPLLCVIVPLSYFLVEKPAMRYGKGLSRRVRLSH